MTPMVKTGVEKGAPYPYSTYITGIEFSQVHHSAGHGDNWAITWAPDDNMYTVYCDGRGFDNNMDDYSLGHAKIMGTPPDFSGENIVSNFYVAGTSVGGGPKGMKTSGMLALNDGTGDIMYQWVRNYNLDGGAAVVWSADFAKTWTMADWYFPELGCPSWMNAGKNYGYAKDDYMYFYTQDKPKAYLAANDLVMGRVHKTKARYKENYEFFAGFDTANNPIWSSSIDDRKPVFTDPGRVYRVSVNYIKGIDRYIFMTCNGDDMGQEKQGTGYNLGIYESPNPWGPWSTIYWTEKSGGQVEQWFSPNIPQKWISEDGLSFYMLYSCFCKGPYRFNIQKVRLFKDGEPNA